MLCVEGRPDPILRVARSPSLGLEGSTSTQGTPQHRPVLIAMTTRASTTAAIEPQTMPVIDMPFEAAPNRFTRRKPTPPSTTAMLPRMPPNRRDDPRLFGDHRVGSDYGPRTDELMAA